MIPTATTDGTSATRPPGNAVWTVLIGALAIRWTYALALFAAMGDAGLKGEDSYRYVDAAKAFAAAIADGSVHGWDWLGSYTEIMPIFGGLTALAYLLFGESGPLAYVLMQGVADSIACVLVLRIAQAIDPRYALFAGVAAAINPTQIVMSGLIYPDTFFVLFVALSLLGSVRWLRAPSITDAALIAVGLSGAALCRILIAPWLAALLCLLFLGAALQSTLSKRSFAQLAAIAVVVSLSVSPLLARNVVKYESWALTSQSGIHLMTVVPWVRYAHDGTPWAQGNRELSEALARKPPVDASNPFKQSRAYSEVALDAWRSMGIVPTVKAWAYGAAINLISPAVILSPPVILIPRTGFYGTPGGSMAEKTWNFLFRSEGSSYTLILLVSAIGTAVVRLLQLLGGFSLLGHAWRSRPCGLLVLALMALWFCFILAVNGPVASPKYRLPLEPVLNVLTGMGFYRLWAWRKSWRPQPGLG